MKLEPAYEGKTGSIVLGAAAGVAGGIATYATLIRTLYADSYNFRATEHGIEADIRHTRRAKSIAHDYGAQMTVKDLKSTIHTEQKHLMTVEAQRPADYHSSGVLGVELATDLTTGMALGAFAAVALLKHKYQQSHTTQAVVAQA